MRKILLLFLLSFLVQTNAIYSQKNFTDNLHANVSCNFGYNLPEYPFIYSLTNDYIRSLEVTVFKKTTGKNLWEEIYNYPDQGLSIFYSTLGNNEVFGKELALTYFFRTYFLTFNRLRFYNRIGFGLSYVSRKFDIQNNYLNVAVGSNFNFHFNFRLGANYSISEKVGLYTGISFDHFSNGNMSEPNLGINYVTGYFGGSFSLGETTKREKHVIENHVKKNSSILFLSTGGKHSRALSSKFYFTSSLSYEFSRAFFRKFHFGIGGDLFYDSSVKNSLEKMSKNYKPSNSFQTGIHVTQSLVYNRVSLSLQQGVYLLLTEKVDNYPIYTRGIIQYEVSKRMLLRLSMKSHFHILDYPEFGFGFKL
ncbi:MAG: acyloxyacyl hydrolase [Brumimicrobium sp.]|nr:acyloxyacyl hydrolase [Brumimicrobium sp.]